MNLLSFGVSCNIEKSLVPCPAVDEREEMVLLLERPGEELRGKVEKAVDRCPRAALSLVEDGEAG